MFNSPAEGFPLDDFLWMSMDGQGIEWHRKIAEIYNRLSRVHKRYKQTTDRWTGDSK